MKKVKFQIAFIGAMVLMISLCQGARAQQRALQIKWDEWNVPHILATDQSQAFYASGWAQMKMHGNKILKLYGQARGEAAAYWGREYLQSDMQKRRLQIPARAEKWFAAQNSEMKGYLREYVKGMNDYIKSHPDEFTSESKALLPVRPTDPLANLQVVYHLAVAGFALNPQAQQWKNAGSNAWAIGPRKSASGKAMLLMQPHPPWVFDSYLFFESHVVTPENNVYGISALGAPVMAMGFNEHLGWALTFNQADAMDLYDLDVNDEGYVFEGKRTAFEEVKETIRIKEGAGFVEETVVAKKSHFGWVVEEKNGKALALRLGGLDKPFFMQQFFEMGQSKNLKEFEKAVSKLQLPLQNVVYADKHGEIFYLYNGEIPVRNSENYGQWQQVQDGSKKENLVTEYLSYAQLPKFKNPPSGFISNTNNPAWSSTHPPVLKAADYPAYIGPSFMDLRAQRALRMLASADKISFDQLEEMTFSSHSELADLVVPQLIAFSEKSADPRVKASLQVLKSWDRSFNKDSKGAVLFADWVFATNGGRFTRRFGTSELFAPMQLTEEALNKWGGSVKNIDQKYGDLSIAWGEVEKLAFGGAMMPSSVGLNETGSFMAGQYRPMNDKANVLIVGPSFSATVEFGEKVRAKGLLSYGNASQEPYMKSGKQLKLLSERSLRKIYFYPESLENAKVITEIPRASK